MPDANRRNAALCGAAVLACLALTAGGALRAQSSTTNPYRATFGWEQLPAGRVLGTVSGVFPDPDGRHLWILDRCGANQCAGSDLDPIQKFDLEGNVVESFGAGLFGFPHGFFLDHEGFLWVTEGGAHGDSRATPGEQIGIGHQVLKLNQRGEVVHAPGRGGRLGRRRAALQRALGRGRGAQRRHLGFGRTPRRQQPDRQILGRRQVPAGGRRRGRLGEQGGGAFQRSARHQDGLAGARVRRRSRQQPDPGVRFRMADLLYIWTHYGKPSGLFIDRNDILYAGDGLSGMVRTGPPDNWRSNLGWEKGIRIGSLQTEQAWVTHFIPHHEVDVGAGVEFLGVDFDGNIYAGEVSRRRLVRYVQHRPSELLGP